MENNKEKVDNSFLLIRINPGADRRVFMTFSFCGYATKILKNEGLFMGLRFWEIFNPFEQEADQFQKTYYTKSSNDDLGYDTHYLRACFWLIVTDSDNQFRFPG